MRFLHVSDTHIGFSAYHKVTPDGLNQREKDFFDAFRRAIDLALEERVDAVLHSGDLFDSVRPTNRAVAFAMDEIRRLGDVPFVAIAGNHETPKLKETGSVFRFLDFLPNARAVYRGRYEVVRVGDVAFHCVPHAPSEEALHAELERVEKAPDARWNVLTFHAGVVGVADFRSGEFNEHTVPTSYLRRDLDYIGVGHYHKPTRLAPNACYAGSTERSSFKEAGESKGVYLVDLERGTQEFRDLAPRPMVALPTLACAGLAEVEVGPAIYRALADADLEGRIVRLKATGIPPHVYATLDFQRIRKLAERALHCQVVYEVADATRGSGEREDASIGSLAQEFDAFFSEVPVDGLDRARLRSGATAFIEAAERGGRPA